MKLIDSIKIKRKDRALHLDWEFGLRVRKIIDEIDKAVSAMTDRYPGCFLDCWESYEYFKAEGFEVVHHKSWSVWANEKEYYVKKPKIER